MNVLENFKNLFLEIWQTGIAGVNFTQIGLAIAIFLFFLLLRGLISKFILQRLKNYVAKTSNKFDDALVQASEGPVKFFPVVLGIFMASSYMDFDGKMSTDSLPVFTQDDSFDLRIYGINKSGTIPNYMYIYNVQLKQTGAPGEVEIINFKSFEKTQFIIDLSFN